MFYSNKRWYRSRKYQVVVFIFAVVIILYYMSIQDTPQHEQDLDSTKRLEESDDYQTFSDGLVDGNIGVHLNLLTTNLKPVEDKHWTTDGAKKPLEASVKKTVTVEPASKDRSSVIAYIESKLQEALKEDKGTGCNIPKMDPFAKEITDLEHEVGDIVCPGTDWVRCHLSECRVIDEVLATTSHVSCTYRDILYVSDQRGPKLGAPAAVAGGGAYTLRRSDHVKVSCNGTKVEGGVPSKWTGYALGFRAAAAPKAAPPGREDALNVLILGFDSTSRNGFIRRMPKSYKYLTEELGATVLEGYNIVGDGTPAALFPILTGKMELEYPDVRKVKSKRTIDFMPFIFYKLRDDGYRTAYFEDMPWIGTFQYRFNGFRHQPADHYLRAFFLEESSQGRSWWGKGKKNKYCVGDRPRFKLMLNITDQFQQLPGKRFCFTFIADITHDDFNMISAADGDTRAFLAAFRRRGLLRDTLLVVMGDHGSRFSKGRNTLQGKLEERLPLMAIVLPEALKQRLPAAQSALESNARVLTTPHDVHATVLHALGMTQHWNPYRVPGADLARGLTLLEPIPSNRSCSEAGVEAHWCACLAWRSVPAAAPLYGRTAAALLDHINGLTEPVRAQCAPRTLAGIEWVMRQQHSTSMLQFSDAKDADGYLGNFNSKVKPTKETFQIKIAVGPGHGVYEASLTYSVPDDTFEVNTRDISRTNAYGDEPACISATHPHLNMFCYCND